MSLNDNNHWNGKSKEKNKRMSNFLITYSCNLYKESYVIKQNENLIKKESNSDKKEKVKFPLFIRETIYIKNENKRAMTGDEFLKFIAEEISFRHFRYRDSKSIKNLIIDWVDYDE